MKNLKNLLVQTILLFNMTSSTTSNDFTLNDFVVSSAKIQDCMENRTEVSFVVGGDKKICPLEWLSEIRTMRVHKEITLLLKEEGQLYTIAIEPIFDVAPVPLDHMNLMKYIFRMHHHTDGSYVVLRSTDFKDKGKDVIRILCELFLWASIIKLSDQIGDINFGENLLSLLRFNDLETIISYIFGSTDDEKISNELISDRFQGVFDYLGYKKPENTPYTLNDLLKQKLCKESLYLFKNFFDDNFAISIINAVSTGEIIIKQSNLYDKCGQIINPFS